MASISTGVGLISGIDIEDTVTKLMEIEKRPLVALQERIQDIKDKKTIFAELTARLLKLKLDATPLYGSGNIFTTRTATSSNESVLKASAQRGTPMGNYTFTVKSLVQAHQVVSSGYSSAQATVGAGTITIESGNGYVDRATALDSLNGGSGVSAGSIYITDRSGRSATVDLSGAITMQDVLDTINSTAGIGVRASVSGDHLVLTDITGASGYNLTVEESGYGSTAADLGILGSVAAGTLTGANVVRISGETFLDTLNDGLGVRLSEGLDDFRITRRDGVQIDVSITGAQTVQDVLDAINTDAANADGKLVASISADGTGIALADSTGGAGDLSVTALNASKAAQDLGILGSVAADALEGERVVAELNTVLLRSINGGAGVAAGSIRITNRLGASADVDLSSARTLSQVTDAINAAGISVAAGVNASGSGLVLTDSSGGSGTLSVAEVDSTTAANLGLLKSVASSTLRADNAQMQYIGERTLLSSLNNGKGVYAGKFRIINSAGRAATIDLTQSDDVRIEDVLAEINSSGAQVTASINATGDGILLTDNSGGTGTFRVEDVNGTTAKDLKIRGSASSTDPAHIDGSFEYRVAIAATDTLETVADALNKSGAPISSMVMNDGSRTAPYRLSIISSRAGSSGRMVIDTGDIDLNLITTQQARDAAVLYGQDLPGSERMLVTSTSNSITNVVKGMTLNLVGVSSSPVTVSVTADDERVVSAMSDFVTDWNAIIDQIKAVTKYDSESQKAGPLLGDPTIMRIEDAMNRMITRVVSGASPTLNRLSRIGISFMQTGKLTFDAVKMRAALSTQRDDVDTLITAADVGVGEYTADLIDSLTDEYDSVIQRKAAQYDATMGVYQEHADSLTLRLVRVREGLYNQFYAMEDALSKLQTQKTAIQNMTSLLTYSSSKRNS